MLHRSGKSSHLCPVILKEKFVFNIEYDPKTLQKVVGFSKMK
jgi:hypothetical protein